MAITNPVLTKECTAVLSANTSPEREARLDAWLALTGQTPAPAQPVQLPLLSGSMAPAIPVGSLLQITVAATTPCCPGDVVVFMDQDRLIAHRVLLVLRAGPWRWLLEKGDANPTGKWRHEDSVRGRVLSFNLPDQSTATTPGDATLASAGLRRHIIHWLTSCGGLRADKAES